MSSHKGLVSTFGKSYLYYLEVYTNKPKLDYWTSSYNQPFGDTFVKNSCQHFGLVSALVHDPNHCTCADHSNALAESCCLTTQRRRRQAGPRWRPSARPKPTTPPSCTPRTQSCRLPPLRSRLRLGRGSPPTQGSSCDPQQLPQRAKCRESNAISTVKAQRKAEERELMCCAALTVGWRRRLGSGSAGRRSQRSAGPSGFGLEW